MTITVGLFEAKTKLSELVSRVERGEDVVITRRGKTVARITSPKATPVDPGSGGVDADSLLRIADRFSQTVKGEFSSADIDTILYDEDGLPK